METLKTAFVYVPLLCLEVLDLSILIGLYDRCLENHTHTAVSNMTKKGALCSRFVNFSCLRSEQAHHQQKFYPL